MTKPRGLQTKGSALWADVTADYQLRSDELRILEAACHTVDEIARLEQVLAEDEMVVPGSRGQRRVHPAVERVAEHRRLLIALVKQLGLPDIDATTGQVQPSARSVAARRAAEVRWSRHNAAKAGS